MQLKPHLFLYLFMESKGVHNFEHKFYTYNQDLALTTLHSGGNYLDLNKSINLLQKSYLCIVPA